LIGILKYHKFFSILGLSIGKNVEEDLLFSSLQRSERTLKAKQSRQGSKVSFEKVLIKGFIRI